MVVVMRHHITEAADDLHTEAIVMDHLDTEDHLLTEGALRTVGTLIIMNHLQRELHLRTGRLLTETFRRTGLLSLMTVVTSFPTTWTGTASRITRWIGWIGKLAGPTEATLSLT
jgi:hypothetical protein